MHKYIFQINGHGTEQIFRWTSDEIPAIFFSWVPGRVPEETSENKLFRNDLGKCWKKCVMMYGVPKAFLVKLLRTNNTGVVVSEFRTAFYMVLYRFIVQSLVLFGQSGLFRGSSSNSFFQKFLQGRSNIT